MSQLETRGLLFLHYNAFLDITISLSLSLSLSHLFSICGLTSVTPPVCPERIQRQWDACNLKGWDGARGEEEWNYR